MTTTGGTPDTDDVAAYLRDDADSWTTDELAGALAAEVAAQGRSCRIPADPATLPDDLREAVLRRVRANLNRRALRAGVEDPQFLPARDPEVRRLEGPWRRLVVG